MELRNLAVQITRFVDNHQPGWVICEFTDAQGSRHTFVEKVPVLTSEDLRAGTIYPRPGSLPCEILARWQDSAGTELVRISTARPLDDKSAEGLSEFVVTADQLSTESDQSWSRTVPLRKL